jgi:hypothetical protein
VPCGE